MEPAVQTPEAVEEEVVETAEEEVVADDFEAPPSYLRQLDICPPDKLQFPITVIGAGAIGSAVVLAISKMGCQNITVFDHDTLEAHNVPNQICLSAAVGEGKVEALDALIRNLCGYGLQAKKPFKYTGQTVEGVLVLAVDDMDTRINIWKWIQENSRRQPDLIIDARMGAEVGRIHSAYMNDTLGVEAFDANLYPSSEALELPCSARSIIFCPIVLGGLVAALIKKHAMDQDIPHNLALDMENLGIVRF